MEHQVIYIYTYVNISQNMSTTRDFCLRMKLKERHPIVARMPQYIPTPPASFVNMQHPALGSEPLREVQLAGRTTSLLTPGRLWGGSPLAFLSNLHPPMRFVFTPDLGKDGGKKSKCPAPTGTSLYSPVSGLARKTTCRE